MTREGWDSRMMMLAEWWSQWSTCSGPACGAVVYDDDHQVLVSGYNGAPRGLPHCTVQERVLDAGGHCLLCVHAESNCELQAARLGIALRGATLASLLRPCIRCARRAAQVGYRRVVYRHNYDSDAAKDAALDTLRAAGIEVVQLDVTPLQQALSAALKVAQYPFKEVR